MNGHCDHCDANCSRVVGKRRDHVGQRNEAEWVDGKCSACAERERIVAFMHSEADNAVQYEWPESHAINRVADFIEDGEHARSKA